MTWQTFYCVVVYSRRCTARERHFDTLDQARSYAGVQRALGRRVYEFTRVVRAKEGCGKSGENLAIPDGAKAREGRASC